MKTLVLLLLATFCTQINCISQNRISTWDIEKITSIQLEIRTSSGELESKVFADKEKINKIMNFLQQVDFKEYVVKNEVVHPREHWNYKIIFTGQRDQIFIYDDFAFIGKTRFLVDKKVSIDFAKLIEQL
ncbi:MAG: hypothetical protein K9J13_05880 [Saprospiraceae bacterium]|nr:hypothetical protein [Saprospiraceae bacterium]